ncbi:ribosomal RNA small subunit methyltransferase A [Candidatus Methylacidiphilum fumarolicum]|uniref:16S rRNA (adenine(1518)-N(6)/adenine(1519)-N(6))- dimethyltransferase RsmA n=1 Tax=Candidatus Methylacidiphilum fumarolicum TaxID=591154 RepID=UPI000AA40C9B|nr:16S rRNA (adenine(1518)-N(6)/adenine(1519)-N(6))-dimethyltransferase RsmA [Candidatus Methylacidiphilum fumarolicum]MBW6414125.1 16S rRNA (adenine(1518)-N(6)/adenine(1519)-N(6))-dimethyltransferase RsmA [Candidatus Methylacidiphilum fumarolicum]TFE75310.1 ribosomal RNA small subunit methyltransferase A [Candidatus Methylacidiphilum fumarolicum]TFE76214.1 ribosomal RNA small subunit methyltransferase A [Candidatus Methylacidiphilum fumarolicum]
MTLFEIKSLLSTYHLSPLKQLSQNFLIDQNMAKLIVRESLHGMPLPLEVYEIGPGLGALTEFFLNENISLKAIEIDRGFCKVLQERFGSNPKFELIQGNALDFPFPHVKKDTILVGNLPYNIASLLLVKLSLLPELFPRMVFTLQHEVALRLLASPKTKQFGALSVLIQSLFHIKRLRTLPKELFYPLPNVFSAVVLFEPKGTAASLTATDRTSFYAFVRKGFSQRRKKLSKVLGIPLEKRAEEIPPEHWIKLWREFKDSSIAKKVGVCKN